MIWLSQKSIEPRWCFFRTACPRKQNDTLRFIFSNNP